MPGGPSCYKVERLWVKPAKVPPGTDGHQTRTLYEKAATWPLAHLTASQTLCGVVITAVMPSIPRAARPVEAPTSRFDSRGCPFHRHLGPRAEEAGRTSATRLLQLAAPEGHERDMVPGIRDPQERPEGDQDS